MTKAASELHHVPAPGRKRFDPAPARDLVDFHLRWQEFRPFAVDLLQGLPGETAQSDTLRSLIELADRVRDDDIGAGGAQ